MDSYSKGGRKTLLGLWAPKLLHKQMFIAKQHQDDAHVIKVFMFMPLTIIQHFYNPSMLMGLIRLFLNTASETSRLIPVWEIQFQTIAPRYLMPVLLKSNFTEGRCK